MGQTHSLVLPCAGALVLLGAYALYTQLVRPHMRPRIAPGPASAHWFYGNMREVWADARGGLHAQLLAQHGPVVSYFGVGNKPRLLTTDLRALTHVLTHTDVYQKPGHARRMLEQTLGRGVLVAEGDAHRVQRKALNPAFGPGQVRDLTGVMLDKANELRDLLSATLGTAESTQLNVLSYFSRCTLDIIGLAGFGYAFSSLSPAGADNELAAAFDTVFGAAQKPSAIDVLGMLVPGVRYLPTARNRRIGRAMGVMRRIGAQLLAERRAAAVADAAQGEKLADSRARDILSLLVRANTAADARQRLSDEDVLAQIPTFLVAGHETTSTLLAWALFALAQRPDVQAALRAECRGAPLPTAAHRNAPLDADALGALDRLPLLDAVVRETLRLHAPVPSTVRAATRDDALPLDAPFVDRAGVTRTSVPVRRGEAVLVPVSLVNRSRAIWGADADEWRPERWTDAGAELGKGVPGVWGHVLSFLGGPHACIGYKFSLYETKIILHALVCAFDVALAVAPGDVGLKRGIVSRPCVLGREGEGAQMPVVLRRAAAEEN